MDFHQNTVPETDNNNQNNVNYTTDTNDGTQYNQPVEDTVQNTNGVSDQAQMSYGNSAQSPYQPQQPYGNSAQSPYQTQQPYGNNVQSPYQPQQPYGNNVQSPYQPQQPYGNEGRYPYQNNSTPNYQNGYNPNYRRYAYPANVLEPGSKLATAAMVLGIISIISCFTFTVYPAFITGSIAVVLALLSKGRRPKFLHNARIGIICAVIGLVSNILLITGVTVMYFTNDDFRARVNQNYEAQYGQTLDEILEEIFENSGYTD